MIKRLQLFAIGTVFLALAGICCAQAGEIKIVSPRAYEDTEGKGGLVDEGAFAPFRVQQVFPAADFAALGDKPHWLVHTTFRPDQSLTSPRTVLFPDNQFRFATMPVGPLNLSLRFDDNLGSDFQHWTNVATVPEPTSIALASLGILVLFCHPKRGRVLATILAALVLALPGAIAYGQGQILERRFVHDQVQRGYTLYVPSNYNPQAALPLVVNMHGYGGSGAIQMLGSGMNAVAEREGFLVAYPDAVNGDWFAGQENVAFIDRLIGEVSSQHSVNASQVFATGFSQGGMMSYVLGALRPYTFAAIAPVAGTYNVIPARPTPLLHIHGTADTFVSYSSVDPLIRTFVTRNGGDLTPNITDLPDINTSDRTTVQLLTYGGGNYLDNAGKPHEAEVLLYRVQNGGHNWPGDYVGWPDTFAPVNYDISASTEIWNFFSRHEVAARPGWSLNADGDWSHAANWNIPVPNSTGAEATFGLVINSPRTVAVDVPITVGRISLDSPNAYTIAGPNTITLDVASGNALIDVTRGSHSISAQVALADNAVITVAPADGNLSITGALSASGVNLTKNGAGSLTVNHLRTSTLSVNAGAVVIAPNGGDPGTSAVHTLSVNGTSRFDLNNNDLVVHATPATKDAVHGDIEADIVSAQNGLDANLVTKWDGPGITSSTARAGNVAQGFDLTGIGVIRNSDLDITTGIPNSSYTSFSGQTVTPDDVLVKYTYLGDGNLSGVVSFDDYVGMDNAFFGLIPNLGWASGDINFDGVINFDDYSKVDQAFFFQSAPLGSGDTVAAVPEPAAGSILLVSALVVFFSWRRRTSLRLRQ